MRKKLVIKEPRYGDVIKLKKALPQLKKNSILIFQDTGYTTNDIHGDSFYLNKSLATTDWFTDMKQNTHNPQYRFNDKTKTLEKVKDNIKFYIKDQIYKIK